MTAERDPFAMTPHEWLQAAQTAWAERDHWSALAASNIAAAAVVVERAEEPYQTDIRWVRVDLMGRDSIIGSIRGTTVAGVSMVRVDVYAPCLQCGSREDEVPCPADHTGQRLVHQRFLGHGAIYAMRDVTVQEALEYGQTLAPPPQCPRESRCWLAPDHPGDCEELPF